MFIAAYAALLQEWESFTKMDARWSGKIATLGQFLLMLVVVILPRFTEPALYITVLISFVSAIDYIKEFIFNRLYFI